LVAPNPVKNKEFAKVLGKVMKRPASFVIPAFLMRLVLGEVSTVVLDGQRLSSKKLEILGFTFQYPELKEALEDVI
jgi:NAD dependent epimerase/dehydratase family enzyme